MLKSKSPNHPKGSPHFTKVVKEEVKAKFWGADLPCDMRITKNFIKNLSCDCSGMLSG